MGERQPGFVRFPFLVSSAFPGFECSTGDHCLGWWFTERWWDFLLAGHYVGRIVFVIDHVGRNLVEAGNLSRARFATIGVWGGLNYSIRHY